MVVCIGEEITKVAWRGFVGRKWKEDSNVREFIQNNYDNIEEREKKLALIDDLICGAYGLNEKQKNIVYQWEGN